MNTGNEGTPVDGFEEFANSGEVEVGDSNAAPKAEGDDSQPAGDGDDSQPGGEGDDGEEGEGEGEGEGKTDDEKKRSREARNRQIARLKAERAEARDEARILREALKIIQGGRTENEGLRNQNGDGNSDSEIGPAPDPTDTAKYPLGHLDEKYTEDKAEWLATKKAAERADTVLQRQQENQRLAQAEEHQTALLQKVDDLAVKGAEVYEDYQEAVVEAGMRGDWALGQSTFEAAHESEHGHQILYELSQDKKEASRVAALSPFQQLKFVQTRDAEISEKAKAKKIPGAGAPPTTQTKGANSSTKIRGDTDNLDNFEKAWLAEEGKR